MSAIFRRELKAFFLSPVAYVTLAAFYVFSGFFFVFGTIYSDTTDISIVFNNIFTIIMLTTPLLTMKLLSDDKRQKTDQALLTAPVSLSGIVFGKFLATFVVFLAEVAMLFIYAITMAFFATPEWSTIFGYLLGLTLLGAAMIAIGLFISSLTESQVIAAVGTMVVGLAFSFLDVIAGQIPAALSFVSSFLTSLSFFTHYNEFTRGILNISSVLYFLSVIGVFVFLTTRVLEKKRWS